MVSNIGVTRDLLALSAAVLRATSDSQASPFYASRAFDLSTSPAVDLTGVVTGDLLIVGGETFFIIGIDLGNDVLTVDRNISNVNNGGAWSIHSNLNTLLRSIDGSDVGGDDYIEGNGSDDMIRGGFGQDDIIGGSSSLFGLSTPDMRPDGDRCHLRWKRSASCS